jgi:glycerophosphoryl diester phosphodiesterase
MKILSFFCLLLLLNLSSCAEIHTGESQPGEWLTDSTPIVVSHRAVISPDFPENSLQSLRIAHEAEILMHEIDLRETSDGELVILHDHTLERTTMGHGPVSDHSWEQLRDIRLKNSTETIPHFNQFLEYARDNNQLLMLDLKGVDIQNVARSLTLFNMHNNALLLTFSREAALEALQLDPPVMVSILITSMEDYTFYEENTPDNQLWIAYLNQSAPLELFEQVKAKGRKIVSDTMGRIDREARETGKDIYREFISERKIDIIVSDYPVEVMQAL